MKSLIILAIVIAFHQYDQDSDSSYFAVVISNVYDTKEINIRIPFKEKKISVGDTVRIHEGDFNPLSDTLGWEEGVFDYPDDTYTDDDYNANEYPINFLAHNAY